MKQLPGRVVFAVLLSTLAPIGTAFSQTPPAAPPAAKGPDKEVAEKIVVLNKAVADTKFAHDADGLAAIDFLLQKSRAGLDAKDQQAVVKALGGALTGGKRTHEKAELHMGAAAALGYCGADGAKLLKNAYLDKNRFPAKPDWVRLREQLLKNLGRTKDESMVKFLVDEAKDANEATLMATAGEALGNFEDSKEAIRKEIVEQLLKRYGSLSEQASQLGTNQQAQNAQDILATVQDKWNGTLAKLTRQSFNKFTEWQSWHNKHKNLPW